MMQGIYTAASGMKFQLEALNEISSNLANVSTSGYKRTQAIAQSFGDLVVDFAKPTELSDVSLGVQHAGVARFEAQGPLIRTNNPLHFALSGPGYFQALAPNGAVSLSRNGDFRLDAEGYLATQSGERVLDAANQPIRLGDLGAGQMAMREDGTLVVNGAPYARLKVVAEAEAGAFPAGRLSAPMLEGGFTVSQGYLEGSNVNVVTEMVNLITTNRAFGFGQKAITAQDNLLNKTVNDLGRVQ